MFKQYKLKNYRFRLIAYVVILCIIGVMVVGSQNLPFKINRLSV